MKRFVHFFLLMLIPGVFSAKTEAQVVMTSDSIVMSASYKNEVYYKMQDGIIKVSLRDQWDIAFRTRVMSSSIITNDGTNVILYTYPNSDTTGWATLDTTGISTWTPMYNDPSDWENGAFSRNQKGHPDYGWGRYNDATHDIVGDSLFVIQLRNGSFKKLWIQRKHSSGDTWYFKYANLDGTDEVSMTKDLTGLQTTDFYGLNMETDLWVGYQPFANRWDILFTKYKGINSNQPYTVTGVLSNDSVKVNRFHPISLDYENWSAAPWDSTRSPIGYDWKVFNSGTSTYDIVDSLVYFVKARSGSVYKLYFTRFDGSATGVVVFKKGKIPGVGINDMQFGKDAVNVYPNPANERINLYFNEPLEGSATITLNDITGKTIFRNTVIKGTAEFSIAAGNYRPGLYFVSVSNAAGTKIKKVLISR